MCTRLAPGMWKEACDNEATVAVSHARGKQPRIAATQVSISASGCAFAIIAANIYPDIGSNMFTHRG